MTIVAPVDVSAGLITEDRVPALSPTIVAQALEELRMLTRSSRLDWSRQVKESFLRAGWTDRFTVAEWAAIPWYGPLDVWVDDVDVSDILVNGAGRDVRIVQKGSRLTTGMFLHRSWIEFVERQLLYRSGLIDPQNPYHWPKSAMIGTADRRLRYAITQSPATPDGPTMAIRILPQRWRKLKDMIAAKIISEAACTMMLEALRCGVTVLIAGGTGSGKTTLTAALLQEIGEEKRVVLIEEARELPELPDSVAMEIGPSDLTFADGVRFGLRQKPDLIVVGECRGPEALAMLQAAATGHPGIGTIHAGDTQGALKNLERMACEGGETTPQIVRGMMTSSTVPLIVVHVGKYDGKRRVGTIEETTPMGAGGAAGDKYTTNQLFAYDPARDDVMKRYPVQGAWGKGRF